MLHISISYGLQFDTLIDTAVNGSLSLELHLHSLKFRGEGGREMLASNWVCIMVLGLDYR